MPTIKEKISEDLKGAMLSGDKNLVTVLRGIKSVILNAEVEKNAREQGLENEAVINLLSKEVKSREEAADIYAKAGDSARSEAELSEKSIIERYLPEPISQDEISRITDEIMSSIGEVSTADMGRIIGLVRQKAGPSADGALIARLVKERIK